MSDPGHSDMSSGYMPGYKEARPFRRRAKRFQGSTWAPPSMSSDPQDGMYCRFHKQFHGYSHMGISYDKASDGSGVWIILWSCRATGNVLGMTECRKKGANDEG